MTSHKRLAAGLLLLVAGLAPAQTGTGAGTQQQTGGGQQGATQQGAGTQQAAQTPPAPPPPVGPKFFIGLVVTADPLDKDAVDKAKAELAKAAPAVKATDPVKAVDLALAASRRPPVFPNPALPAGPSKLPDPVAVAGVGSLPQAGAGDALLSLALLSARATPKPPPADPNALKFRYSWVRLAAREMELLGLGAGNANEEEAKAKRDAGEVYVVKGLGVVVYSRVAPAAPAAAAGTPAPAAGPVDYYALVRQLPDTEAVTDAHLAEPRVSSTVPFAFDVLLTAEGKQRLTALTTTYKSQPNSGRLMAVVMDEAAVVLSNIARPIDTGRLSFAERLGLRQAELTAIYEKFRLMARAN